jgi:hypothetical protein
MPFATLTSSGMSLARTGSMRGTAMRRSGGIATSTRAPASGSNPRWVAPDHPARRAPRPDRRNAAMRVPSGVTEGDPTA